MSFDRQVASMRNEVVATGFRLATPLDDTRSAMTEFVPDLDGFTFKGGGKLPMVTLQRDLEQQLTEVIDRLNLEEKWRAFLKDKIVSGLYFTSNLVEVIPRVLASKGYDCEPIGLIRSKTFLSGINQVGMYAQNMGPILDVVFSTHCEEVTGEWFVRESAEKDLRKGHFVEGNFDINADGGVPNFAIAKHCMRTLRAEMASLKGLSEGGCPAHMIPVGNGVGNLLKLMASKVVDVCTSNYDFKVLEDPLVPIVKPSFEFPRSKRPYEA